MAALSQLMPLVKRSLPWVGAAILLSYIALTTNWDSAWHALQQANPFPVVSVLLVGTLSAFLLDSLGVSLAFSRFVSPVGWRQAMPIKATSYLLNVINYSAALVGMAWYLQRIRDVSFWKALGSLFVLNVMDLVALGVLMAAGLLVNTDRNEVHPVAVGIAWLMVGGASLGFPLLIVTMQKGLNVPLLSRLASLSILAPLREFRWQFLPPLLAVRLGLLGVYFTIQVLFLPQFGIHVPLSVLLFYFPLGTFVQIVPIAPSGLGTMHAFNRWAFSGYVDPGLGDPDGVLDACTTAIIVVGLAVRVVVAWAFLGKFSKEVIRQASGKTSASVDP